MAKTFNSTKYGTIKVIIDSCRLGTWLHFITETGQLITSDEADIISKKMKYPISTIPKDFNGYSLKVSSSTL